MESELIQVKTSRSTARLDASVELMIVGHVLSPVAIPSAWFPIRGQATDLQVPILLSPTRRLPLLAKGSISAQRLFAAARSTATSYALLPRPDPPQAPHDR